MAKLFTKKEKKTNDNCSKKLYIIGVLVVGILSLIIGSTVTYYAFYSDSGNKECVSTNDKNIDKFVSIYKELLERYYTDLEEGELITGAINGMLSATGDVHTSYYDKDEAATFNERMEGSYIGIGSEIIQDIDGNIYISQVFSNSPVEEAGLRAGDRLVSVNGTSTEGKTTSEVSALIKGNKTVGVSSTIVYERDGEEYTTTMVTALVVIPSITSQIFEVEDKKIGYIDISIFAANTAGQFTKALKELGDIDGLIIDVRNNSGGYASTVSAMLDATLPLGSVKYQTRYKNNIEKIMVEVGGNLDVPMVVLQNGASASGSEMLTIAYKEVLNATVIGTTSYGKGTVQGVRELSDGSMVKYTIKEWLSPEGNSINNVGVVPDINVELDAEYYNEPTVENDNQLQRAFSELTK